MLVVRTVRHTIPSIILSFRHMAAHVILFYQAALLALVPFVTLLLCGWIVPFSANGNSICSQNCGVQGGADGGIKQQALSANMASANVFSPNVVSTSVTASGSKTDATDSQSRIDNVISAMSHGQGSRDGAELERTVAKGKKTLSKYQRRELGSVISLYENGRFLKVIQKEDAVAIDSSRTDISLIAIGSLNRVFVASIFSTRWDGPIVFVFYLKKEEEAAFQSQLLQPENAILWSSRIRIITYVVTKECFFYSNYPINILRNIGIRNTHTTHFIVLDMDMWMGKNSYQQLLSLPHEVLDSYKTTVVIPAFFHTGWPIVNGTFEEQVNSVRDKIPFTMDELLKCYAEKRCSFQKKNLFTHLYVPTKWITDKTKGVYVEYYNYTCWKNYLQEPYLLVRRNDSITAFHEAFINYGFNKISFVEMLRREEYRFVLAGRVFAFDLPHLPSHYQKSHATNTKSGNYLTNYYFTQGLLKRTKNNTHILPLCKFCVSCTPVVVKKQFHRTPKLFMPSSVVDHKHRHLFCAQASLLH